MTRPKVKAPTASSVHRRKKVINLNPSLFLQLLFDGGNRSVSVRALNRFHSNKTKALVSLKLFGGLGC